MSDNPELIGLENTPTNKLIFKRALLETIIAEAEAENNLLLDHPELRDFRPGAREQLATVQAEIDKRIANGETIPDHIEIIFAVSPPIPPQDDLDHPKDQVVGLKTLVLRAQIGAGSLDPDRKP